MELTNKLLIIDLLIVIIGLFILFIKPFGWDMTFGISMIVVSFIISIVLFLIKMTVWEKTKVVQ